MRRFAQPQLATPVPLFGNQQQHAPPVARTILQHADALIHRVDHRVVGTARRHLLHRFGDLGALVGEILHHLNAMIEPHDGNFSILARHQLVEHASDVLDLGQEVGEVGAALHRDHQRKRLIPHVRVDLLQFVVIVKFEILQLQSVHELAIAVAHGGGRNDDVGGRSEREHRAESGWWKRRRRWTCLASERLGRIESPGRLSKSAGTNTAAQMRKISAWRMTLVWHIALRFDPG